MTLHRTPASAHFEVAGEAVVLADKLGLAHIGHPTPQRKLSSTGTIVPVRKHINAGRFHSYIEISINGDCPRHGSGGM